jgi:hypothetical protein
MTKTKDTIPQIKEEEKPTEQVVILSPDIKHIYHMVRNSKAERLKVRIYDATGSYTDHTIFSMVLVNRKLKNAGNTIKMQEVVPMVLLDGCLEVLHNYRENEDIEIIDEKYEKRAYPNPLES